MKIVVFCLSILLTLFNACSKPSSLSGTETGNALAPGGTPNNGPGQTTTLDELISDVCNSVKACEPLADVVECQTQLNQQSGLPQLFGVSAATGITTVSQLATATTPGVAASPALIGSCATGIAAISCQSAAAVGAYDSSTGSYAGVANEISQIPDCGDIY